VDAIGVSGQDDGESEPEPVEPDDGQVGPLDALSQLLRAVPRGVLLTGPQEWALARRSHGGSESVPPPGPARPTPAQAHGRLIESNLRLVISIARRSANRGVPLEDLIQEGVFGLHRAAERFDPALGNRFSTYATWWIRQAVSAAAGSGRVLRLPPDVIARIPRIRHAEQMLRAVLGRGPTSVEVADELDMSVKDVEGASAIATPAASLDRPIGVEGDLALSDFVVDLSPGPEALSEAGSLVDAVDGVLATLLPRDRMILTLRFGIGSDRPQTLAEVSLQLGISRERTRQIEARALSHLRANSRLRRRLVDWA
jgi:RNA polymerase primary sigma factor